MKRQNIKELINQDISRNVPKLNKKILSAPINTSDNTIDLQVHQKRVAISRQKRVFSWVSAVACVLVVVIVATLCGVYFADNTTQVPVTMQTTCYEISINPSILITTDKDGNVLHIASQNEDGDVVLSSEAFDDYQSKSLEECIKIFVDESAKLGFIDLSNQDNEMTITLVNGENEQKLQTIADNLADNIQQYLKSSNIYLYVQGAVEEVSEFVKAMGWDFSANNIDSYMDNILAQNKYSAANSLGGDFIQQIEDLINGYLNELKQKIQLLNDMQTVNDKIEELYGDDYWACKSDAENQEMSSEITQLLVQGENLLNELKAFDIYIYSSFGLSSKIVKYEIIDEIIDLVENIEEYLENKSAMDLILIFLSEDDIEFYYQLKEEIDMYYDQVLTKITNLYEERIGKYLDLYLNRPEISDDDYDSFLASKNQ